MGDRRDNYMIMVDYEIPPTESENELIPADYSCDGVSLSDEDEKHTQISDRTHNRKQMERCICIAKAFDANLSSDSVIRVTGTAKSKITILQKKKKYLKNHTRKIILVFISYTFT